MSKRIYLSRLCKEEELKSDTVRHWIYKDGFMRGLLSKLGNRYTARRDDFQRELRNRKTVVL